MGRKSANSVSNAAKLTATVMDRMKRSPFDRLSDGNDAWSQLKAAARSGNKRGGRNLDDNDFSTIASHAWTIFQQLKPTIITKYSLTGFTQRAFGAHHISSKELSVVMLPPGESAGKRGIRKGIRSYYLLIKAMAEVSGQNPSRLADTILRGTKLHPMSQIDAGTMTTLEKMHAMLQAIVDKVDEQFGLLRIYQQTAEAKAQAIQAGSRTNWPLCDLELPDPDSKYATQSFREEREAASDPQKAFWRIDNHYRASSSAYIYVGDMSLVRNDSFFYTPHALLGHLLIWDLPDRRDDPLEFDLALAREIAAVRKKQHYIDTDLAPRDEWDPVINCPKGQTDPMEANSLQYTFWIVAYPDPVEQKLVPCLYMPSAEEGTPYLIPIGIETLSMLQRTYWISSTDCKPAFDRLVELVTEQDQDGDNLILAGIRRTAPWLQFNPVLKEAAKKVEAENKLNTAFRALVGSTADQLMDTSKNMTEKT